MSKASENLRLLTAVMDHVPLAIWVGNNGHGSTVYTNRALTQILGPVSEEALPFADIIRSHPTGGTTHLSIRRADGTLLQTHATVTAFADGHVMVSFGDSAREIQAEQARQQAEERLRRVVNGAPIILFAVDADGIITLSEGRSLTALGFAPGQLVGRSVFDLYRDPPRLQESIRQAFASALAGESFVRRVNVGAITMETTFSPLLDEAGHPHGAVGVSVDVTQQEHMQRQLLHADRMAAVGTLAAGAAHEINNPVTAIAFAAEALNTTLQRAALPERSQQSARELLAQIHHGTERISGIVRDLKTFARPEDDDGAQQQADVRQVFDAAERMTAYALIHRARIEREGAPVPLVRGASSRLEQVLVNLILNAVQSFPDGRTDNRIILRSSEASDKRVVIEVQDNGAGIAPEHRSHIFDPFFTTKPVGVGTGLGLAISHGIISQLGGEIAVDSEVGIGTTVRLFLKPAWSSTPAALEVPAPHLERKRILVIDDEPSLVITLKMALEDVHDVTGMTCPVEALALLSSPNVTFDLVLCDVMMPKMSGMEFYQRILELHPQLAPRIVFMTGGAMSASSETFLQERPHLLKPFAPRMVDEVLARLQSSSKSGGGSRTFRGSS